MVNDVLDEAIKNALIYGTGFIKIIYESGNFVLDVVPIEDYKYLRINERGLVEVIK